MLVSRDSSTSYKNVLASGRGADRIVIYEVFWWLSVRVALLFWMIIGLMLAEIQVQSRLASSFCSSSWSYDDDKMNGWGEVSVYNFFYVDMLFNFSFFIYFGFATNEI